MGKPNPESVDYSTIWKKDLANLFRVGWFRVGLGLVWGVWLGLILNPCPLPYRFKVTGATATLRERWLCGGIGRTHFLNRIGQAWRRLSLRSADPLLCSKWPLVERFEEGTYMTPAIRGGELDFEIHDSDRHITKTAVFL